MACIRIFPHKFTGYIILLLVGKYKVNPKINKMFNIRRNWLKPAAAGALKGQFTLYRSNVWAGSAKIIKGVTAFRLR